MSRQSFMIRPSPRLGWLVLAMAAANLGAAAWMATQLSGPLAVLAGTGWAALVIAGCVAHIANRRASRPAWLEFDGFGACCWRDGSADPVEAKLTRVVNLGATFTALELRVPGAKRYIVPVASDSLPANRHRALRVAASMAMHHGSR